MTEACLPLRRPKPTPKPKESLRLLVHWLNGAVGQSWHVQTAAEEKSGQVLLQLEVARRT